MVVISCQHFMTCLNSNAFTLYLQTDSIRCFAHNLQTATDERSLSASRWLRPDLDERKRMRFLPA